MSAWLGDPLARERLAALLGVLLVSIALVRAWRRWCRLEASAHAMTEQFGALQGRVADLEARTLGLERVQEAQVSDARHRHDDGVSELLGSLLRLNEEVRSSAWLGAPAAESVAIRQGEVS